MVQRIRFPLFLIFTLWICLGTAGEAVDEQALHWLDYQLAQADVTLAFSYDGNEETILGRINLDLPNRFSFAYLDDEGNQIRRILGYQGLTSTYERGRTRYEYEPFQLFSVFEELFIPLARILDLPGEWVGEDRIAHREVYRYQIGEGDHMSTFWIDKQTGIPLRVIQGETDIVTVITYQYNPNFEEHFSSIQLRVDFEKASGTMHLKFSDGHWFLEKVQIGDEGGTVDIAFANWEIVDQELDLGSLVNLAEALNKGQRAYAASRWEQVITAYREVLTIDPFHVPGYFYLAYGHGLGGNYLGAVENYQQALMLQPHNSLALNNLAYTYMLQEVHLKEALELALLAVTFDRRPAYLDTVGFGYHLLGQYEQAIEYFYESLVEIEDESRGEVLSHLVQAYRALGDFEQAKHYEDELGKWENESGLKEGESLDG